MPLKPTPIPPVPEETTRVAQAAFPKGNPYLTLRGHLGVIFQDDDWTWSHQCVHIWEARPPHASYGF